MNRVAFVYNRDFDSKILFEEKLSERFYRIILTVLVIVAPVECYET
jgi:hypothetical protein